ncbi:SSU ribosomal protein S6P [Fervidobacterium pennivorans DSM 9078]|jgi:small subunit ribosomal protein S6|uniref:Small ribosomal subunit protein bS6 n=1 Tax=Fervidobacterium pennivorans (strain DSM 9078 / Ven5) TaxID=771875 RepID=H9UA36_FERPD|nr:30S ribosomal protein S6 [Fervidobacterium pennivorans]AFG34379.1 SSU ribosomal protein S6P [Fervidobacterium pennivorans DSM 9078]QIV77728.1 30S ribosomal protein S6 [Fervidobacterium pennivorans subsp. keratinolyticus]
MRIYETMFIIKPDVPEEERNNLVEGVKKFLEERLGAQVENVDRWGIRKLAYKIGKYFEGDYTVIYFRSNGQGLDQLENYFKVHPDFMRWQTFRREDLEKKERKAARAKKEAESSSQEGQQEGASEEKVE